MQHRKKRFAYSGDAVALGPVTVVEVHTAEPPAGRPVTECSDHSSVPFELVRELVDKPLRLPRRGNMQD